MTVESELTEAEETLLRSILSGNRAELGGAPVRASVLRALATGANPDWPLPPAGLSLYNAAIVGLLDLEGCTLEKPLVFLHCHFQPASTDRSALLLRDAQLKRIALYDCTIGGPIKADRASIDTAFFLTNCTVQGLIRLRGTSIGEALAMDGSHIKNTGDTAILADGLRLGGPWIMRECTVEGETRFAGARISGGLLWEDASFKCAKVAVNADSAIAESAWVLRRAKISGTTRARGLHVKAIDAANIELTASSEALNLRGADIASDLILEGARITGGILLGRASIGGELSARGAEVKGTAKEWAIAAGGVTIKQGLSLAGASLTGGISLAGANVGQGILANNITIDGDGRAIEADVMQLGGNWVMRDGRIKGSIRLAGARIEGQLALTACKIEGGGDLAIRADGAEIRGGWFMGRAEVRGLVRLPAARLGNEMRLRATTISVAAGPALFANGVTIARELVLDGGFTATGAVALDHAEINGTIELSGSRISSAKLARDNAIVARNYDAILDARYDEVAISLVDARADRLVMPSTAADRPRGIVDLSRAHVGSFEDDAAAWPPSARARKGEKRGRAPDGRDIDHLILDGFVYEHLEHPDGRASAATKAERRGSAAEMRIRWLEGQCESDLDQHFKPQAWMQLARRLAGQGYQDDAREIAIARRRRQRKGASTGPLAKVQGWCLDVFALYGFNPWRTVVWMGVFVLLFAGAWSLAARECDQSDCKDERVFVMALKGNFGQNDARSEANYPPFSALAYSFDVFVPFVSFGYEEHWRPRIAHGPLAEIPLPPLTGEARTLTITKGGLLYVLYVVEIIIGLVLTSLAVTGFTGMLSNNED